MDKSIAVATPHVHTNRQVTRPLPLINSSADRSNRHLDASLIHISHAYPHKLFPPAKHPSYLSTTLPPHSLRTQSYHPLGSIHPSIN
ncbi:unnamed protein product [Periconia digitata]|uniref:Uncharacterized protein n=1 Tax=Periconia digitata TaxID=1303443 RepID=A0A9W4U6N1_9PLEO|nr:unnamed protein product [Periconia digitata]